MLSNKLSHFPKLLHNISVKFNVNIKLICLKFYLINEFLKPHNTLEIVVWAKERNTKSLWGFKFDLKNVKIKLGTFKKYQLFK